jgi:uncharacterized membrane protein
MIDEANSAVQKHIELQHAIINRMAANSSNCKTWCITIVSALLVISYQQTNIAIANLSYLPLLLFFFLDSYYLSLERDVRLYLNDFVHALHQGTLERERIFTIIATPFSGRRLLQTKLSRLSGSPNLLCPIHLTGKS